MIWWSVDPGQVHVGIAIWDKDKLSDAYETSPEEFLAECHLGWPSHIVIEGFSLSGSAYSRSKAKQAIDTLKLIGFVQFSSVYFNFQVFEQQPAVRHVAQRSPFWTKLITDYPMGGNSHVRSAVSHGLYWLNFTETGKEYRKNWAGL